LHTKNENKYAERLRCCG